jgi:hypothetical protein
MTELLEWLNKDLRLSKKVQTVEEDFKNGFLFKEVFRKIGVDFTQPIVDKYAPVSSLLFKKKRRLKR